MVITEWFEKGQQIRHRQIDTGWLVAFSITVSIPASKQVLISDPIPAHKPTLLSHIPSQQYLPGTVLCLVKFSRNKHFYKFNFDTFRSRKIVPGELTRKNWHRKTNPIVFIPFSITYPKLSCIRFLISDSSLYIKPYKVDPCIPGTIFWKNCPVKNRHSNIYRGKNWH